MVDESLSHFFLDCPFATQCWSFIGLQTVQHSDLFQNVQSFKHQLRVPFFQNFLMAWTIRKSRNDLNRVHGASQFFLAELQLLLLRAKRRYFPLIEQWIANNLA
jgi:hypothetical protein